MTRLHGQPHNQPDVSVVICAYTEARWGDLTRAVRSVQRQAVAAREIVLVIDHNPRLLARALHELDGVRVIENAETRGLSGARNSGIQAARGEIVAFLDDDAAAEPDWLTHLLPAYADPQVLGVGGAILPRWNGVRPVWLPEEFDWVVGCTYRGMPQETAPVRNLIGCNMSFRRDVFATVGGFRSVLGRVGTRPVGCEETELCIRAIQQHPDGRLLFEPRAQVRHRVPDSRESWRYFAARCFAEGQSKAVMSRLVGANDGLASERIHVLRTLPRGVIAGLADTTLRGDLAGLSRAAAIVGGLALTASGFAFTSLSRSTQVTSDVRQDSPRASTPDVPVSAV